MVRLNALSRILAVVLATILFAPGVPLPASATPVLAQTISSIAQSNYNVMSPDGTRLYVMSQTSKQLQVIDTATNTVIDTYLLSGITTDQVVYLTISPDGTKIYASGYGGSAISSAIFVIDLTSNTPNVSDTISLGTTLSSSIATVGGSAITPDGSTLYVTLPKDGKVKIIDTVSKTITSEITVTSTTNSSYNLVYPSHVAVGPDGQYFFVTFTALVPTISGYSGYVSMRVSDRTVIDQTEFGLMDQASSSTPTAKPWGITVSSNSQTLYVSSLTSGSGWLKSVSINPNGTFGAVSTTNVSGKVLGDVRLSADDSLLYVTGYITGASGSLLVFPTSTMTSPTTVLLSYVNTNSMIAPARDSTSHAAYVGSTTNNVYLVGEFITPSIQVLNKSTGSAFSSAAMTATGLPGTVTYSISPGLPSGLSFDTATGVISGSATSPLATTIFTISGTNGTSTATARITLTVTSGSGGGGSNSTPSNDSYSLANTGFDAVPYYITAGVLLLSGVVFASSARRLSRKK